MSVEIKVPTLGESVTEATVARWFKKAGEAVSADEPLVELETDKVTLEVNAPASGRLAEVAVDRGQRRRGRRRARQDRGGRWRCGSRPRPAGTSPRRRKRRC